MQQRWGLVALPGELGLIPSDFLFWPPQAPGMHRVYRHTRKQNIQIHKMNAMVYSIHIVYRLDFSIAQTTSCLSNVLLFFLVQKAPLSLLTAAVVPTALAVLVLRHLFLQSFLIYTGSSSHTLLQEPWIPCNAHWYVALFSLWTLSSIIKKYFPPVYHVVLT